VLAVTGDTVSFWGSDEVCADLVACVCVLRGAQDGTEVLFKIKKHTPLKKLMDAYCARQGVQANSLRFLYDGERIGPESSPKEVRECVSGPSVLCPVRLVPWCFGRLLTLGYCHAMSHVSLSHPTLPS